MTPVPTAARLGLLVGTEVKRGVRHGGAGRSLASGWAQGFLSHPWWLGLPANSCQAPLIGVPRLCLLPLLFLSPVLFAAAKSGRALPSPGRD